jgi:L-asparaginase
MSDIALVTMGGTIDKDYFDALSEYQVAETLMPSLISRIGCDIEIETHEVCRKDSLEVTEADRLRLKQLVESLSANRVLVTHGTDTMVNTARFLGNIPGKVIVFTGAMRPSRFADTDALFNVGVALGALRTLKEGVFVAMSGQVFDPKDVVKNRDKKRFELGQ